MYSGIFLLLAATTLLVNCVTCSDQRNSSQTIEHKSNEDNYPNAMTSILYAATTPRIVEKKSSDSSEEDSEEDDFETETETQQEFKVPNNPSSGNLEPLLKMFNTVSNALMKSVSRNAGSQLIGFENDQEFPAGKLLNKSDDASDGKDKPNSVGEGRYIQGDPLNGYYDFIITEGSYKFWVVFQLGTAALLIYSTLAAIYYSKVNPLTSDYDYVDYLSKRSFNGRAMSEDSADVEDETAIESGRTYLSSLSENNLFRYAAYGFQFAMEAIDKVPT